jgi:hypothetical protein
VSETGPPLPEDVSGRRADSSQRRADAAQPLAGSAQPLADAGPGRADTDAAVDLALRIAGGLIAVVAALVTAAAELILSTLRIGGTLIGVAVPVAIVANVLLSRFAYAAVGRTWAIGLPALAWFAVIFMAATGTTEGDIGLAANNWVGLAIITLGSLTFGVMAFRLITASARR